MAYCQGCAYLERKVAGMEDMYTELEMACYDVLGNPGAGKIPDHIRALTTTTRAAALEEAAKACQVIALQFPHASERHRAVCAAIDAIRALIEKEPTR